MHKFKTILFLLLLFAFSTAQTALSATSTSSIQPTRQTRMSHVCGQDYNCSDVEIVGQPCQCEQTCILRGDCCRMTFEVCFPNVTFNDTGNGPMPEQNQTSQFLCETIGCRSVVLQVLPCQCDSGCAARGDCCGDYTTVCHTPLTPTPLDIQTTTTAADKNVFLTPTVKATQFLCETIGCRSVMLQVLPCQCDSGCAARGDCCGDYTAVCHIPSTPTSLDIQTTTTATDRNVFLTPTVTATQAQSPDSTEVVATQQWSSASSTSSALPVSSSATEPPTGDRSSENPTNATLSVPTVEAVPGCYLYGCNNRSDAYECQCDSECLFRLDCCDDAINLCAGSEVGTFSPTLPFTCAEIGCGSTGARCSCVSDCLITSKCCGDYTTECSLTETSLPTSTTSAIPTRLPSCVALSKILNKSACAFRDGQLCQCDSRCSVADDCCPDIDVSICAPTPGPTTPSLPTTERATTVLVTRASTKPPPLLCANEGCDVYNPDAPCQCLPNCVTYRDCCSDFVNFCKYNGTFSPPTTSSTSSRSSTTVRASRKPPPLLCANEGCDVYNPNAPCQCLPNCVTYRDCCSDFVNFCKYNGTFSPPTTSSTSSRSSTAVRASRKPPPLLCANEGCDVYNPNAPCQCLPNCVTYRDCCSDFVDFCKYNGTFPPPTTSSTSSRSSTTVRASRKPPPLLCANEGCDVYNPNAPCQCLPNCVTYRDCCSDFVNFCKYNGTFSPPTTSSTSSRSSTTVRASRKPPSLLCANEGCDVYNPNAPCQCLPNCVTYRDCCSDFVDFCKYNGTFPPPTTSSTSSRSSTTVRASRKPPPLLCANEGCDVYNPNAPCQCLPNCVTYQDCCSDFVVFCEHNGTLPSSVASPSLSRSSTAVKASTASSGTETIATATLGGAGTTGPPPAPTGSSKSWIAISSPSRKTVESTTSRSSSSGFASFASSSSGVVITAVPSSSPTPNKIATTASLVSTVVENITRGSPSLVPASAASLSPSTRGATNTSPTIRLSTTLTSKEVTTFSTTGRISTASFAKGTSLAPTSLVATASSGKGTLLFLTSRLSTASSANEGRKPSSSPSLTESVHVHGSTSSLSSRPVSTSTTSSTSISTAALTKRSWSSRQAVVATFTSSHRATTSASLPGPVTSANLSAMSPLFSTVSPRQVTASARTGTSTKQVDVMATIPLDQQKHVNSLTEDEKKNCLTMNFAKVELSVWIRLHEESFRQAIAVALRESSSNRRKRAVADATANDVIYVAPTPQIVDNYLRVVFFVRDCGSTIKTVEISLLQQAVVKQKTQIGRRVSVLVVSIRQGIPQDLVDDSSDNTILIIAIVCSVAVAMLILIYVLVRHRLKYNVTGSRYGGDYSLLNINDVIDDFAEPTSVTMYRMYRKKEDDSSSDVVAMTTFGSGNEKNTHLKTMA